MSLDTGIFEIWLGLNKQLHCNEVAPEIRNQIEIDDWIYFKQSEVFAWKGNEMFKCHLQFKNVNYNQRQLRIHVDYE